MSYEGVILDVRIDLLVGNTYFIVKGGIDMTSIDITSVSTKGQIVIPNDIRKSLNLESGSKLIVIQEGDNILLKPIQRPSISEFQKIFEMGDKVRKELDLKEEDINQVIKEVRKSRANRR